MHCGLKEITGLAVLIAAVFTLSSCGIGMDNEALFTRASAAVEARDLRAAIIDLKAILQRDPAHAEARLMLGQAYVDAGEPLAAEKELRRALELGIPRERVVVPLCKSVLAQGAYNIVLQEASTEPRLGESDRVDLALIRGDAELGLGRMDRAHVEYVSALEIDANNGIAYLGLASIAMVQGEITQAAQFLDRSVEVDSDLALAWLSRGEFFLGARDREQAEANFLRALELATGDENEAVRQRALAGLTDVYLVNGDLESASARVAQLKDMAPDSLLARYSDARVEFARGELDAAVQLLQDILKDEPDNRKAQLLYGAVSRAKGNLAQAEMYLASVVANWPSNEQARRMLADVRLRQNKFSDATETLAPLLDDVSADDELLAIAGVVKMQAGEGAAGLELFERSVAADPDNYARALDLAALYLAADRIDEAAGLLESLRGTDADLSRVNILELLIMERSGARADAVRNVQELLTSSPDDPRLLVVAGGLYQRSGNMSAAKTALERAIELDPSLTSAIMSLGRTEASSGQIAVAKSHFNRVLQLEPDNAQVMTEMSRLSMADGDIATAVSWLERAREKSTTAIAPRVRLAMHYLSQNRLTDALTVAEETVAINRNDARAHNILGVVRMAAGEFAAASPSFAEAVDRAPHVPAYRLNFARAEMQRGNDAAAWKMMRESYDKHPNHIPTATQLAAFHLRYKRYDDAMDVAERLERALPDRVAGVVLRAEVLAAQSRYAEAAALLDEALKKEDTRKLALRAFQLRKSASSADPFAPLVDYVSRNRSDTVARMQLAEALLASGESSRAASHYEKVLAGSPYNLVALNNLSWILVEQNDPRAREFAEIAYNYLPDNAAIADTYGYVLLKLGDAREAAEVLQHAADAMPEHEGIRERLDEALRQSQQISD